MAGKPLTLEAIGRVPGLQDMATSAPGRTWTTSRKPSQRYVEPSISRYSPDWNCEDLAKFREEYIRTHERKDGHYIESYRFASGYNQQ